MTAINDKKSKWSALVLKLAQLNDCMMVS